MYSLGLLNACWPTGRQLELTLPFNAQPGSCVSIALAVPYNLGIHHDICVKATLCHTRSMHTDL